MLRELHISNLAVISDVRIELAPGLNCFTGATGAGKSLVIGALEVLLGLRSAAEMVRPGSDEGRVSGVFEARNAELLQAIQDATDIPVTQDGGELLLTRRLYASGRSSVSLNGNPITLSMLKQVAENLVDVHGQHDHQYLLKAANQIDVLDQFGDLWALRRRYHHAFQQVVEAKRRIAELSDNRSLRQQQLDLYRYQAKEIDAAALEPNEYERLQARAAVLQNLERLKSEVADVHGSLYEAEGSVLERLKSMTGSLAELTELDPNLKGCAAAIRDATIQLEEVAYDLARYSDKLELDPGELAEVNERLNVLNRILHKYGDPLDATLAYRVEIGEKLAELEKATDDLAALQSQLKPLIHSLKSLGEELSTKRAAVARRLGPLVEKQLAYLGMEKAKFDVTLTAATGSVEGEPLPATPSGFDMVEFVAQTNPGQLAQPLRKIASGGELSRIMLALKGILAQSDRISVLVFDEIDANVGGRLGSIIGNKLRSLAEHHQVLCITHLPQIASYADRHLTVRKEVLNNLTETKVRVMEGADRIQELSEMIGGQRITETTRAQAQELLDAARAEFQRVSPPPPPPAAAPAAPSANGTAAKKAKPPRNPKPMNAK